jgi:Carbohydrate family 9 binding domain-like
MKTIDWKDEWNGLEPEQPSSGRCGCWIGVLILLLGLVITCAGTAYFAWRQLGIPPEAGAASDLLSAPPPITLPAVDGDPISTEVAGPEATQPALVATVTLSSEAGVPISEDIQARAMQTPPLIDGNLREWADIPGYESANLVYSIEGWDQSDDVRAFWRLGWDEQNLYAAAQVEDDVHVQTQQGSTVFKGDGVSIQLDTQRAADFGRGLSQDDFQINLSPGDFGSNLGELGSHGVRVAALRTEDGYTLEAVIPWSDLGVSPSPGMLMGIALNVNDNDTPGTAEQEVMKSHVASRQFDDPTSWGIVILQ